MTKTELRLLYLLRKLGGKAKQYQLHQATSRLSTAQRDDALHILEDLGLVQSGISPSKTRPALLYWLTSAGKEYVEEAIARGEMGDPR